MGTDCASDGTAISNYQIRNNSSTTLYYSIQYRIQVMLHTKLQMQVMSWQQVQFLNIFTSSSVRKIYRMEIYSCSRCRSTSVTTPPTRAKVHRPTAILLIQAFDIAQGSCSDGTKYGYFYAKNGSIATSDVYFRVYVSIDGGAFDLVTTRLCLQIVRLS